MAKTIYRLYPDMNDKGTLAIRNKKTGKFRGRRVVKKGERSDRTFPLRVKSPPEFSGEILGRSESIPVKGSVRARGYVRQL